MLFYITIVDRNLIYQFEATVLIVSIFVNPRSGGHWGNVGGCLKMKRCCTQTANIHFMVPLIQLTMSLFATFKQKS